MSTPHGLYKDIADIDELRQMRWDLLVECELSRGDVNRYARALDHLGRCQKRLFELTNNPIYR
jgi:hypothetical protein